MKLEDQVVSLELAKKMKELGFKQESYFYWQGYLYSGKVVDLVDGGPEELEDDYDYVSAYTVAELGEMLRVFDKDNYDQVPTWDTYFEKWYFQNGYEHGEIIEWLDEKTEANARAKMLIYLKENNLLEDNTL